MRRRTLMMGVPAVAGALLVGAAAMAEPGHGYHHGFGYDEARIERMADRLDLTTDQRTRIRAVVDAARPEMRKAMDALHDGRRALWTAMRSDTYDAHAVRKLADAQGKAQADMMVLRADIEHRITEVLTPEQRDQLTKMRGRHHRRAG